MKTDDNEDREESSEHHHHHEGITPAILAAGMGTMDGAGSVALGPFGTPQGAAMGVALAANLEEEEPVNPPADAEPKE